jgi:putative ABC transport system permease protein
MEGIWQDLRYGLRRLARERGLSGTVILILALGIGPNALVFSVLRASLLRPLPYADPERLVMVWNSSPDSPRLGVGVEELEQWTQQRGLFGSVAGFRLQPGLVLTGVAEPERLSALALSPSLFDVLGVHAVVGRNFLEGSPANEEIILSYDLWRRRFNADRSIVGRRLTVSEREYTVVGVMPEGFDFPRLIYPRWNAVDAWVPLKASPSESRNRTLAVVARLRHGVSTEAASRRLTDLLPAGARPDVTGVSVVNMHQVVVREVREGLLLLAGAVGLVLLLACANVANLLLTSAEARQRDEIGRASCRERVCLQV